MNIINIILTLIVGGIPMLVLTSSLVLGTIVEWYGLHRDKIDSIKSESFREFIKKEVNGCRLS